ncbi:hypothetical protein FDP41_007517 [Naegleria fowleri]|uniref:Uncharacterized protein n=1 Tax=Naegleria fowleri TaxID=5763 RepID=A0A6A5CFJ1_NAEFO|nr:uncharacterized protein FDP41_007517 [Naegleria fowleri]KAF0984340.1 hypothetical protein FDP41_007517 [Naegleria fowleri]
MISHSSRVQRSFFLHLALFVSFLCLVIGGSASCCWAQETNRVALNPSTLQSWELASSLSFCKRKLVVSPSSTPSGGSDSQQGSSSGSVLSAVSITSRLVCSSSSGSSGSSSSGSSGSSSITSKQQPLPEVQQAIQGEAPLESIAFLAGLDKSGFSTGVLGLKVTEQGAVNGVLELFSLVKLTVLEKSKQSQSQTSGIPPLLFPNTAGILKTIPFTNTSLQNIRTAYGTKVVGGGNSKVMYYSANADSEIGRLTATCFVAEEPTIMNINLIPSSSTIFSNKNNILLLPESLLLIFSIDNFNAQRVMQSVNMNSAENLELVLSSELGVLGALNMAQQLQQQQKQQSVPDLPYNPDENRHVYSITSQTPTVPKGYLTIPAAAAFGAYSGSSGGGAEISKFITTTQVTATVRLGQGGTTTSSSGQSQTSETTPSSGSSGISGGESEQQQPPGTGTSSNTRIDYSRLDVHIPLSSLTESEMSQDSFIMWGPVYLGHVEQQGSSCSCNTPQLQQQPQQQ